MGLAKDGPSQQGFVGGGGARVGVPRLCQVPKIKEFWRRGGLKVEQKVGDRDFN